MSHYKRFPEYKASGVEWLGDIPVHWKTIRLSFLADFNPSPNWEELEQSGSDYPFLPMEAIGETGSLDWTRKKPLAEAKSGYTYFSEGDVVYAKVTPCFENGKGAVIRGLESRHGFGTTELTVLRPKGTTPEFLYAILHSYAFRDPAASSMTGAGGLKRVPDDFARRFVVAVPSISEQREQASGLYRALKRIDALISKKTRFIELLKEKRQVLITRAVTKGLNPNVKMKDSGVEWIGSVPTGWNVGPIKRWFKTTSGATPDTSQEEKYYVRGGAGIPWIRTMDLTNGPVDKFEVGLRQVAINDTACKLLPIGSVLIAMYGGDGTIGKNGLLAFESTTNQAICALIPNIHFDERFTLYFVQFYRPHWMIGAVSTRKDPNISQELIRDAVIVCPPIEEQREVVRALDKELTRIDLLTEKSEKSIALLSERRSALITAAVTGQIDVRGVA